MPQDPTPDGVDARALQARAGQHRRDPVLRAGVDHAEGPREILGGHLGLPDPLAVGLVDRDDVGDLEDALLDALQLVARPREREEQEGVDHAGDRDLRLADADGLDEDDVEACRLQDRHGLARGPRDTAEGPGRGGRADVRVAVDRQRGHPRLVTQDRAAGADAGRVDREHADLVPATGQVRAERLDRGGLADPGHARDADPHGASGIGRQRREQLARRRAVVGPAGLDERDGPRDRRSAPLAHACGQLVDVDRHHRRPALSPAAGRGACRAATGRSRR